MRPGDEIVSVIIPVYNGERFLAEAIDSVFAQDYRPIEVIVVDDGSGDHSAEIAKSYAHVRVISQENRGLSAARNAGIAAATGAFLAFVDADDVMLPAKLTKQVDYMQRHPEVGCTLGAWEVFGDDIDRELPDVPPPPDGPLDVTTPQALVHLRAGGISAVIERNALDVVGLFDTSFDFAEDLEWLFRLRDSSVTAVILPHVVGRKRFHASNMTWDRAAALDGWLKTLRKVAGRKHAKNGRS
jgi:glycosyltransferase involved in cell wall biosynthesis